MIYLTSFGPEYIQRLQLSLCPARRLVEQVIELTHSSGESDVGCPFDCNLLLELQTNQHKFSKTEYSHLQ